MPTNWHSAGSVAFRPCSGCDNLKTGNVHGAGHWGQINSADRSYVRYVSFHIDVCLPRCKIEKKVGVLKRLWRPIADLEAMQDDSDGQLTAGTSGGPAY